MLSRKSLKITIFLTEIVCMVLELCASYLFSPFFGNSHNVWTGIIGVILLSNSIGNYIGGRLAEKKDKDYVPFIFLLTSVFVFILGIGNDIICHLIFTTIPNATIGSLIASFILLLPSAICLGTIAPQVMVRTAGKSEKDIKFIYMLSTIGGLVGTFVGGYFMIPTMGVNVIVLVCGLICIILGFDLKKDKKIINTLSANIALVGIFIFMIVSNGNNSLIYKDTLVFDSEYNRIVIEDATLIKEDAPIRKMSMAAGFESATYLEEEKRNDLIFAYLKSFANVVDEEYANGKDMLMIGGAAYQFPKYALSHYEDCTIDVVEIDGKVTELAKKYFFLQDCIDEYDPDGVRMGMFTEDAKVYIKRCKKTYDVIFNDAFSGKEPVRTLTTIESIKEIKSLLNEGGVYVMNIHGSKNDYDREFLKAECKTLNEVFPYIYINYVDNDFPDNENEQINYRVIASSKPLDLESIDINYNEAITLTDNYCPVDNMYK